MRQVDLSKLRRIAWVLALSWFLLTTPAFSQGWVLEGIADAEYWRTTDGSRLLERNDGEPAPLGRLQLWGALGLHPKLQLFALGEFEGGNATPEGSSETELEQIALRYTINDRLMLEAGKLLTPVGSFAIRRFSNRNPLIGSPDSYDVTYPWGVQVSGTASRFDYKVAIMDEPATNEKYVPEPSSAARPALAGGVTVMTGLRVGTFLTWGPYLSKDLTPMMPAGDDWKDFDQEILGIDVQFSRGYLEIYGEAFVTTYEVPTQTETTDGVAYYVEAKYTWTPRFFTAIRVERNDYPFIAPVNPAFWIATRINFYNHEIGVGYRPLPDTIIKLSYRWDDWQVSPPLSSILVDGHALALQVSHRFDVKSWFDRKQ